VSCYRNFDSGRQQLFGLGIAAIKGVVTSLRIDCWNYPRYLFARTIAEIDLARAVLVLTQTFYNPVIPTAVKASARFYQRASRGPQARRFCAFGVGVGRRDLVLAFKVHAICKTALEPREWSSIDLNASSSSGFSEILTLAADQLSRKSMRTKIHSLHSRISR
jgi:hypothetical protein